MKDLVSVYVAPEYSIDRVNPEYRIVGWRYEALRNNLLIAHGEGFDTVKEAFAAGQRAFRQEESVGEDNL